MSQYNLSLQFCHPPELLQFYGISGRQPISIPDYPAFPNSTFSEPLFLGPQNLICLPAATTLAPLPCISAESRWLPRHPTPLSSCRVRDLKERTISESP